MGGGRGMRDLTLTSGGLFSGYALLYYSVDCGLFGRKGIGCLIESMNIYMRFLFYFL